MKFVFPEKLGYLADKLNKPVYIVGGYVRGMLIDGTPSVDVDLAGPFPTSELLPVIEELCLKVTAEYPRTGTLTFTDGTYRYEFTSFRKDVYAVGGKHSPEKTMPTDDVKLDALRRDFKCNAVYFDVKNKTLVDPLGGIDDIENKTVDTVRDAKEVFSSDGLRLLRLARFCAELDFTPTLSTVEGAKTYAENIDDISPERILDEVNKMLFSDEKYPYSGKNSPFYAFSLLFETGVLQRIFDGEKIKKTSLEILSNCDKKIRLLSLIHAVSKEGENQVGIAEKFLIKLKAKNKDIKEITEVLSLKNRLDLTKNSALKEVAKNYKNATTLLLLSNADKEEIFAKNLEKILEKIKKENIPTSLKELAINGDDLIKTGVKGKAVGETLERIFDCVIADPTLNKREILLKMI